MLKLVMPYCCIGPVIGKQGRIKQKLEQTHNCSIELAPRKNIYSGMELIEGRVLGFISRLANGLRSALRAFLELTGSTSKGFRVLAPDQTAVDLQGQDGIAPRRLAGRLQGHTVRLQLIPRAHVNSPLKEQVINCHGTLDGFSFVVAHVVGDRSWGQQSFACMNQLSPSISRSARPRNVMMVAAAAEASEPSSVSRDLQTDLV